MARFMVKVEGKLLITANDKQAAIERANMFMADKGLPSFKGNDYYTEQVEDGSVVPS